MLAGDEARQPDHARLVTHDEAAGARLAHAPPRRLGQVGRGEHEEGQRGAVWRGPGVGLDVGRGAGAAARLRPPPRQVTLQPGLLGGRGAAVGEAAAAQHTVVAGRHVPVRGVDQLHAAACRHARQTARTRRGPRARQTGAQLGLEPRVGRGSEAADAGALRHHGPRGGHVWRHVGPQQLGRGAVAPQTHGAVLVAAGHRGDERRGHPRHVRGLHGGDELGHGRHLVILQIPQQRGLEAGGAVPGPGGARRQPGTLVTDPESLCPVLPVARHEVGGVDHHPHPAILVHQHHHLRVVRAVRVPRLHTN